MRLTINSVETSTLQLQRCFPALTAKVINYILLGSLLTTYPSIKEDLRALAALKDLSISNLSVGILNYSSISKKNLYTTLTYNLRSVAATIKAATTAILNKFNSKDIVVLIPYIAQKTNKDIGFIYASKIIIALKDCKLYYLRRKLAKVQIYTINSYQGQAAYFVILNQTIIEKLSFIKDTAQVLLAILQYQVATVQIIDVKKLKVANANNYAYTNLIFNKIVRFFKARGLCILLQNCNLENSLVKELSQVLKAPSNRKAFRLYIQESNRRNCIPIFPAYKEINNFASKGFSSNGFNGSGFANKG